MNVNETAKRRIWVNPIIDSTLECPGITGDTIRLIYGIPGVDKKNIQLKMAKDALQLLARREDTEFVNEYCFEGEADLDKVHADYKNGVLVVEIPTCCANPFKNAVSIRVS